MLHYETVSPGTLALLKKLMQLPELKSFRLVGGTTLALYLGHRISVDLDFFTDRSFDVNALRRNLENEQWRFELKNISKTGFTASIDEIKCDFFNWSVPFIGEDFNEDGIRLCSLKDIAAFKLDAVISRKEKKDFWDIDIMLSKFSFTELLQFYRQKYIYNDIKVVLDALSEIDLADETEQPVFILPRGWDDIKNRIESEWKKFQSDRMNKKEAEIQERIRKAEDLLKRRTPPKDAL